MRFALSLLITLLSATAAVAKSCYCGGPSTGGEKFRNKKTWTQICCEENGGIYSVNYIPAMVCERNSCRKMGDKGGFSACYGRLGGGKAICG